MRSALLKSVLAALCVCLVLPLQAAGDALQLSCRHTFAKEPGGLYIILYLTFHNTGTKPLDFFTLLQDPLFTFGEGSLSVHLNGDWPENEPGSGLVPIRERLLPRRLESGASTTIAVQYHMAVLISFPDITNDTPVHCSYRVSKDFAQRYSVWSGFLKAKSSFEPFYERE